MYRALGLVTGGKGVLRQTLIKLENRTGLYDSVSTTAYVQSNAGERAALHTLVHALQDQHFDLRRTMRLPGSSDARIAAAAAIEGHAALVAGALRSRTTSHGGAKLTRFVELERGFTDSVGLRFAADLRNLGGTKAVLGSLRRFPATTEQVFHLSAYLERERALPIVLPVNAAGADPHRRPHLRRARRPRAARRLRRPAPRRRRHGLGRRPQRPLSRRYRRHRAGRPRLGHGRRRAAVGRGRTRVRRQAFDAGEPGPPELTPCAATACWSLGGHAVAFEHVGARTALALGVDLDTLGAARSQPILGRALRCSRGGHSFQGLDLKSTVRFVSRLVRDRPVGLFDRTSDPVPTRRHVTSSDYPGLPDSA